MIIKNLQKSFFGLEVLRNISFDIKNGEIVAIVGPSGCGKSTLFKIIAGLIPFDNGLVEIDERGTIPSLRSGNVGMVMQNPVLFPWLTVRENISFPLNLRFYLQDKDKKQYKVEKVMRLVGLEKFSEYLPHQLSGGMKQRVAIAMGMMVRSNLILLDEPFTSLDEITREEMQFETLSLWRKTKSTILMSTHSFNEAVFIAQKVIVLSKNPSVVKGIVEINLEKNKELRYDISFLEKVKEVKEIFES